MRFPTLLLAFLTAAAPATAQAVDPKGIAALAAAEAGWDMADQLAQEADPVTSDLLMWMRLRDGNGTFAEYQDFLSRRADWPAPDRLRTQSELAIAAEQDPGTVVAWFAQAAPQTAEGAMALARAHFALGQTQKAGDVLAEAWVNLRLSDEGQKAMYDAFGPQLRPHHPARTDALLWRGRAEDAARMLPLLAPDARALAAARIGYMTGTTNMNPLANAVPPALRDDAGLLYDRYSWLAARGDWTEAVKILSDRSTGAVALGEPFRWSGWRRVLARWEMREGRAEQAYALASGHFMTEGEAFVDLEWLAGYLSLIYLGNPTQALTHFENGLGASSGPISLSRMHYWIGRAYEVKADATAAALAYAAAAEHQTAFYGLLASEKLDLPLQASLAGEEVAWRDAPVFADDLTKAAFMLLAAGERGHAVTFFARLGDLLEADELAQVGAYLNEIDEQYYTVLLGKTAAARAVLVPAIYFPLHDLAQMKLPVDPTLALSIARRESEFNIGIGSPAGALGLMQLMPATAEEVAGWLDLPYVRAQLTSDWAYNATLGAAYLAYLQEDFGPSPVMIAAGYNAGPSRPKTWIAERGDPRLREMDVIDWIEHIPFNETRNYVMRVTESIPVYQARLTGRTGVVAFTDLLVGAKPVVRPRARPQPAASLPAVTAPATTAPAATATVPEIRPLARPERG